MKINTRLLLLICLFPISLWGQSKAGYESAGDEALKKHDPYSAIGYYTNALNYENDGQLSFKIGNAYKEIGNYIKSLNFYNEAVFFSKNNPAEYKEALKAQADMLRRLGRIQEAISIFQNDTSNLEFLNDLNDALTFSKDTLPVNTNQLNNQINSAYSDFAPQILGDTLLYFSSMKFESTQKKETIHTSKILSSKINDSIYSDVTMLPDLINMKQWNNANFSISPDGKVIVFTRCLYDENNELRCSLYESVFKNGVMQQPVKLSSAINQAGATSTQPCITGNYEKGYLLFYASDRKSGNGGIDIWYSERNASGVYSKPVNAGSKINSASNEITPFYDREGDTLYFSSDRYNGLGGYDIYKSYFGNDSSKRTLAHLEAPINSGYHDLYFNKSYAKNRRTVLVSNRPPSTQLTEDACCFDIYEIVPSPEKEQQLKAKNDQIAALKSSNPTDEIGFNLQPQALSDRLAIQISRLFPLRLYFDNDYPDPQTRKNTTVSIYDDLVINYLNRLNKYLQFQTQDTEKENITVFFEDSIRGNFLKLEAITNSVYEILELDSSKSLKLTVQGTASPLAESDYNVILSERRIYSILNFWRKWKNGILVPYLENGRLQIQEDPTGESTSTGKVSDDSSDQRNSIFSKSAAIERRIEITEITLIDK
jgi:tetratricopeptide (TPR) repeat protein